jgi:hypothetical protein
MIEQEGAFVDRKRVWEVALTVLVAIGLLAAAEGRYPYGFYMALRTAATVGGVYWAVRVYQAGPRGWIWAFLAVALLLNPILPVQDAPGGLAANRPRSRPALARLVWVLALAHTAAGLTCALSLERPSCPSSLPDERT